nr:hypothetical protein [Dyella sp. ASV24]
MSVFCFRYGDYAVFVDFEVRWAWAIWQAVVIDDTGYVCGWEGFLRLDPDHGPPAVEAIRKALRGRIGELPL